MKRITIICSLLIASTVLADPSSYLEALFYRNDAYSRDGLVAEWSPLDPGVQGDLTQGAGNFEHWIGDASCGTCPVDIYCDCLTYVGTLSQESFIVYKDSSSVQVGPSDGMAVLGMSLPTSFGKVYQYTFKYRGDVGGEVVITIAYGTTSGNYYQPGSDSWAGPLSSINYMATTAWQTASMYVVAEDTVPQTVIFALTNVGADIIYIDDFQVHELSRAAPYSSVGNFQLVNPTTSDPIFGDSKSLMYKAADGPARSNGTWFDAVDDSLTYPDDGDYFDPCTGQKPCQYTIVVKLIPGDAADSVPIGKGNNYSIYYGLGAGISCYVTDSALNIYDAVDPTDLYAGTESTIVCGFTSIGVGTSQLSIDVDNRGTVTNATASYPVLDSADPLSINGYTTSSSNILYVAYYEKALDTISINKAINPYFPANNNNRGSYVTTCDQSAPHATCSAQYCRDGTAYACQAEGTGSQAVFGQYTELVVDNSFESPAGTDENPDWPDWIEDENPGTGIAEITAYRDDTKHGDIALRMKTQRGATGAADTIMLSNCLTTGVGGDLLVYLSAKKLSGVANFRIAISRYDDLVCGSGIGVYTIRSYGDIESSWHTVSGLMTAGNWSTAQNYRIQLVDFMASPGPTASDILVDSVSTKVINYYTPWVENPNGEVTTTYVAKDYRIHNTLADQKPEGTYPYANGFCASAWIYTDWDGTDTTIKGIFASPATAPASKNRVDLYKSTDSLYFCIYDNADNYKCRWLLASVTNWSARNWKYIEVCSNNSGTLNSHWYNLNNSTWYTLSNSTGAGTGIQSSCSTDLYIGEYGVGSNLLNGYIPYFNISPYNATYTYKGFNFGHPPANGARPY